ncbi:MAG: carboxypeptidase-like regulatory domain-containing protein, partial [Terriglobia bacterium]
MRQCVRFLQALSLVILVLAVAGSSRLFAQVDTGTITGTVTDPSGAVIPGATVDLINQGTNFKLTATTDSSGSYTFTPIKIGTYTVEATFRGFQQAVHKDVSVQVQANVNVSFVLQTGSVTQTVQVTAAPPLLETASASVGQVVGQRQVNDLPLNGRNYTFLAQISAGVVSGGQEGRGLDSTGTFSANGVRPAQNNYLLDGMDDNADLVDFLNSTSYVVLPPVDAIQELKVQTTDFSAQFGRAGGAILNATSKSGSNAVHGDAWEFLRNSGLDARNFFETSKGEYRQNQFGATLGGPVTIPHIYNGKNKT